MSGRGRVVAWAAIIGLLTAVIGLGTAVISLQHAAEESQREREKADQERENEERARRDKERELEEARRREAEAREQQRKLQVCAPHLQSLALLENEFNVLMSSHGTMMDALKECTKQSNSSECAMSVCALHWVGSGFKQDCLIVVRDADEIVNSIMREQDAAVKSQCDLPYSAALMYAQE